MAEKDNPPGGRRSTPFTACPKTQLPPVPQVPDLARPKAASLTAHKQLGLVAIALSVAFYIQAAKANASASQALTKIETLAATIHQHAFAMLEQTLQRVPPPVRGETRVQESDAEAAELPKRVLKAELDQELENFGNLYGYLRNLQQQLSAPMSFAKLIGGEDTIRTDIQRVRDLIAVKRAQLRQVYGIDFSQENLEARKNADS